MDKVDAQSELDALFSDCEDIEQIIGYTMVSDSRGREARLAYAKVILAKNPVEPIKMKWPAQLVYKRAIEVGTGVEMFGIYPPGDFLRPLVATEWTDTYQLFIDAADNLKMFAIEFVVPSKRFVAMYVGGKLESCNEENLTPEDYDYCANKTHSPAPDAPRKVLS